MVTRSPTHSSGKIGVDKIHARKIGAELVTGDQRRPDLRRDDKTDYAHRHFVNLASAALLLFIAIAIIWTVKAMDDYQKLQRCIDSGRRNCLDLQIPPRYGVHNPSR